MLLLAECSNGRLKVLVNRDMGEDINKRLLVPLSFNLLSLVLLDDPSIYSVQDHFLVFPFPYDSVNFQMKTVTGT